MSPLIAPSLLSANFADLQSDIEMINRSKADWLHLDIMGVRSEHLFRVPDHRSDRPPL